MRLRYCGLSSVLTGSSVLDAVLVGLLVKEFPPAHVLMDKPQSSGQSTHGVDISASKEDTVQARVLQSVPTAGDVMKWMDSIFMNHAYGAFSLNILSDLALRLLFFILPSLALLFCCKRKKKENSLNEEQLRQILADNRKSQDEFFRSEKFGRILRDQLSENSSAPTPSVRGSQAQANLSGEQLSSIPIVESSNVARSPANCPTGLPTQCENVVRVEQKGPLRKRANRPNGYINDFQNPDPPCSLELASTSSDATNSSLESQAILTQSEEVETGGDHVIDIRTTSFFTTSTSIEIGNKHKRNMKDKLGVSSEQDISSSRIIQARVRVTDENLSALRDVAIDGMKLDKGFTFQIGESFLYYCNGNPEEPVLLSLMDAQVPIVLQADYSAGVLTIWGKYLEGAEIRAATFDGYMILNITQQDKIDNDFPHPERKVEVWRCTDLLPPVNLDQIQICASKTVCIEGKDVTVRSEVVSIQNTSLRTVIRNWIPTAILIVLMAIQAWAFLSSFLNLMTDPLHRTWLSYAVLASSVYIIQLLPPSLEDIISAFVKRLKLAISSFHVLPALLSSPAFIFPRSGYCLQRGAKHFVDYNLFIGGPSHRRSSETDKQGSSDLENNFKRKEDSSKKTTLASKTDDSENSSSSRDWKWPCFGYKFDEGTGKYVLKKLNSEEEQEQEQELHQVSYPFTVTYDREDKHSLGRKDIRNTAFMPKKNIIVKLYSKYLQETIRKLLPSSLKLFRKYGEILANDLFVLFIKKVMELKEANIFEGFDGSEGECLDMFHLIRFLKEDYGETITQYERMIAGNVISWDMLWTLIVPQAEVIYYCDISKEELCGKVLSVDYNDENFKRNPIFNIRLEVYDYNGINFEARKTSREIFHFKGEVNIKDMIVYPVEYDTDPRKAGTVFLIRGRKFYDLVVKDGHRFLQYQGLIWPLPRKYDSGSSRAILSRSSFKENADGRVMLDQGGFAKINADADMGTAEPSKSTRGTGLKMEDAITDESSVLLKYSPAIAYGYSFATRRWGCFTIDGFSEIQFISTAFDSLVMNEDIKNTLLTLTRYHAKHQDVTKDALVNVDPLPHKGKGCIILLYGPSGTGKTLTVESLAEKLECPLWQLSVSYDGNESTDQLETRLIKTFEIAASWGAILLLDEADVFLSARKYSPMSSNVTGSNALTGTFLRILEYYAGVLFLTTNLVDSIETAIFSRMSFFVKYEEFNIEDRKRLWINFFVRTGFEHPSQEFWDAVLPAKFNGRIIRNIVRNAQILAESDGVSLTEKHLLKAFQVMATPSAMSHLIESEDKPDPKESSSTVSTFAPPSEVTVWPES